MSAANPFLGKVHLAYWKSAAGPDRYTWRSSWGMGRPPIGSASVYQNGPIFDHFLVPTYWVVEDSKDPNTCHSGPLSYVSDDGGHSTFGQELGTNLENPRILTIALGGTPALPAIENPSPIGGVDGALSIWDLYGDGAYAVFGWAGTNPEFTSVQLRTDFVMTTHGTWYLHGLHSGQPLPDTDFTFIDISGEDYSWVVLTDPDFSNSFCTGTKFDGAGLAGASFGSGGDITHASFRSAVLTNAKFQGLDCTGVDFTGADLSGVHFTDCTMRGVVFNAALLDGTTFANCDLTGADFTDFKRCGVTPSFAGSMLHHASFSPRTATSDLTGISFAGAKSMVGCTFEKAVLLGTNFDKVPLAGADFKNTDLTGTLLTNTDLRQTIFSIPPVFSTSAEHRTSFAGSTIEYEVLAKAWSYLDLAGAVIDNLPASIPDLQARSSILWDLQLTGLDLARGDFTGADLRQCDLAGSNLSYAVFIGASLQGDTEKRAAILSNALLENANLTGANLTGTQFTGAFLWGEQVTLAEATVVRTNFSGAYLAGVKFIDVAQKACQGANFGRACLVNAIFNGTDCGPYQGQPASFASACLQGANFTDASLDGADLSHAGIASEPVTIDATIQLGWPPQSRQIPLAAAATLGVDGATDHVSVCPNGQTGPCSPAQQQSPRAPTSWPVPSSISLARAETGAAL